MDFYEQFIIIYYLCPSFSVSISFIKSATKFGSSLSKVPFSELKTFFIPTLCDDYTIS